MKTLFCFFVFVQFRFKVIVIIICLLSFSKGYAQYDYRKAAIITHNNDTIFGLIDYGNNRSNSSFCLFKANTTSKSVKYRPDDITGYFFEGSKCYTSKIVEINGIPTTIFIEYLLNGIVDLYFYKDTHNFGFYFIEKEGKLYELVNEEKEFFYKKRYYSKQTKEYIGVLKYLTKDSPEISKKIEKSSLNHKSLIEITKNYHQNVCDSYECIIYSRKEDKVNDAKWIFKIGLSMQYNSPKYLTNELRIAAGGNSPVILYNNITTPNSLKSQNNMFSPGAYINVTHNWRSSFQLELWHENMSFSNNQALFKIQSFSLPILFKRELFAHKKLRPFLGLGFAFRYYYKTDITNYQLQHEFNLLTSSTRQIINNSIIIINEYENRDYNTNFNEKDVLLNNENKKMLGKRWTSYLILSGGLALAVSDKSNISLELRYSASKPFSYKQRIDAVYRLTSEVNLSGFSAILSYNYRLGNKKKE